MDDIAYTVGALAPSNVGLVMCGVAVIAGGLLDHLVFVRMFSAPALDG